MDKLEQEIIESYRRSVEPERESRLLAVLRWIVPFAIAGIMLVASTAVWTPTVEAKDDNGNGWAGENPRRRGPPSQRPPATPVSWGRSGGVGGS